MSSIDLEFCVFAASYTTEKKFTRRMKTLKEGSFRQKELRLEHQNKTISIPIIEFFTTNKFHDMK